MKALVRTNASVAWLVLVTLTLISWALGTEHGFGTNHVPASVLILVLAVFKVRLVGMYFMELRGAIWQLRRGFDVYCVGVLTLLITMYLSA